MAESAGDQSGSSDSASDVNADDLRLQDDDGWDDVEPDDEDLEVVSFYGQADGIFKNATDMVEHCRAKHGLDFGAAVRQFDLDFYGAIKLVNYLRSAAAAGSTLAVPSSKEAFSDDKYLQPVLEDDAVLFGLDDVLSSVKAESQQTGKQPEPNASRIRELEDELKTLRAQFAEYRTAVAETLDKRWDDAPASTNSASASAHQPGQPAKPLVDNDTHYFASYDHNDIHETMLRDAIRTDAYRDFIYANKALFAGKTVLDVGCGTGILSMFAARAGAAHVYAVDNSALTEKTRAIVAANGLADRITVVKANVDADLRAGQMYPLRNLGGKVDILVSEWMGYCLLYEAMLDSVLHARDTFLRPGSAGLMAPSHAALRIAPLSSPDLLDELVNFWPSVYGFDMRAMQPRPPHDVQLRAVPTAHLAGGACSFARLDLRTATVADLSFTSPFACAIDKDIESLDGFALWFDIWFFGAAPDPARWDASGAHAERHPAPEASGDGSVGFTTGPGRGDWTAPGTHWQTGVLVVDRWSAGDASVSAPAGPVAAGSTVVGSVAYRKRAENARELEIEVEWRVEGVDGAVGERGRQMWIMH